MRILIVGSSNYEEGISSIVKNQGNSLADYGLQIAYFGIKGKGAVGYLKNLPRFSKTLRCQKYDIIHAHYGLSGALTLMARKKEKVVISFMGSDLIFPGRFSLKQKIVRKTEVIFNRFFSRYLYDYVIATII